MEMRSPLSRARGLGSTGDGYGHWWLERMSAIALVPLTLWFAWAMTGLVGADLAALKAWAGRGQNAVLLILMISAGLHHWSMGLTVVLEDYVHAEKIRVGAIITVKLAAVLLAALNIFAVLKLVFGS
ncbi:MAG: succinate dehydrogenase, hydrophobic membrane anchor protein [Rhodospirillales bacterium CG15_BIG_FIL_POST_REV_8_21_14_020_66_15]|nr:MAG: succinate dehydrogenase, hydrophobic membrane anchor protein [Rhodospirillales bacterium CG15_BIG_FIL_POST_REV_8_21_14_020_66_15]